MSCVSSEFQCLCCSPAHVCLQTPYPSNVSIFLQCVHFIDITSPTFTLNPVVMFPDLIKQFSQLSVLFTTINVSYLTKATKIGSLYWWHTCLSTCVCVCVCARARARLFVCLHCLALLLLPLHSRCSKAVLTSVPSRFEVFSFFTYCY